MEGVGRNEERVEKVANNLTEMDDEGSKALEVAVNISSDSKLSVELRERGHIGRPYSPSLEVSFFDDASLYLSAIYSFC